MNKVTLPNLGTVLKEKHIIQKYAYYLSGVFVVLIDKGFLIDSFV